MGRLAWLALALLAACSPAPHVLKPSLFVRNAGHEKLVVFIHGVLGDGDSTWRNAETGAYWPEMIRQDREFQDFDIYVVNYESTLVARASTIEEIAQRELQRLRDRKVFARYRQIYFITHSMGGLVAKRILIDLNRPPEVENLRRVRAVLYISTPAQGATIADLASWISLNPQLGDMRPADLNAFLQSLENQWQNLLRDRDVAQAVFPLAFCAYETKLTHGIMVVSRVYAATRCDENAYPVDLSHSDIVKPRDVSADPYPWTRARILAAAAGEPRGPIAAAPPRVVLIAQLHEVALDVKGPLALSQELVGTTSGTIPDDMLDQVVRRVTMHIATGHSLEESGLTVRLRVPADLVTQRITVERAPPGPIELHLWVVRGGGKLRVPLTAETLKNLGQDFDLELHVPGYGTASRRVNWGHALDQTLTLEPMPVRIGIEEFAGDASVARRLAARLGAVPRVRISDPSTLEALRRQIAESRAMLARSPALQTSLRTALGLDFILSGRVDPLPPGR